MSKNVYTKTNEIFDVENKQLFCLLQTSFSLYLYNQQTDFHKLSCAKKP